MHATVCCKRYCWNRYYERKETLPSCHILPFQPILEIGISLFEPVKRAKKSLQHISELWFDEYKGKGTIVIDDFYGNIEYDYLLRLLDGG